MYAVDVDVLMFNRFELRKLTYLNISADVYFMFCGVNLITWAETTFAKVNRQNNTCISVRIQYAFLLLASYYVSIQQSNDFCVCGSEL